jgi:hypothetical protein
VSPLALAYRSLAIPGHVEATRIEPKTGLYNMRHFQNVLSQELQRAARFGHLASDRALKAVANALQSATREYDVAARFGGDEFAASSCPRPISKARSSWRSGPGCSWSARPRTQSSRTAPSTGLSPWARGSPSRTRRLA